MLNFCTEVEVTEVIRKMILTSKEVKLAVAFWGKGAIGKLKLSDARNLFIICDARSGACHPDELAGLLMLKEQGAQIRCLDDLHAKVYWTPSAAVVGSSNASANGLGEEGAEAESKYEANIRLNDPAILKTLESWFDDLFQKSEELSQSIIDQARLRWVPRNQALRLRRLSSKTTLELVSLFTAARKDPDAFRDARIYFALYDEWSDPEAIKQVSKYKKEQAKAKEDPTLKSALRKRWWTYDEWELPPDSWFIDCYKGRRGKLKVNGIARTGSPTHFTFFGRRRKMAWIAFKEKEVCLQDSCFSLTEEDQNLIANRSDELWAFVPPDEAYALVPLQKALSVLL